MRWESESAATPLGPLAYFIECLTLTGLWSRWRENSLLVYTSPNAPTKADVLGTWMISVLWAGLGPFVRLASPHARREAIISITSH